MSFVSKLPLRMVCSRQHAHCGISLDRPLSSPLKLSPPGPFKPYHVEQTSRPQLSSALSQSRKTPICLEWNNRPAAGCPHPNCRYEHICYCCIHMPTISDKHHKAIHCLNKDRKSGAFFIDLCLSLH